MGNFDTGPFVSGFGKVFRPNGHSLVCFSSFKEVEHHCVLIFKSYSLVILTMQKLIHHFGWCLNLRRFQFMHSRLLCIVWPFFGGQPIPWNWGCSITRGLIQFDHATSRHFSVASWRLTSLIGDKVCNKSPKSIWSDKRFLLWTLKLCLRACDLQFHFQLNVFWIFIRKRSRKMALQVVGLE